MTEAERRPRSAAELLRAYYHALGVPRLEAIEGLFAPDAEWRFPGTALRGGQQVRRAMARSLSTGLRMQHDIHTLLEQGDVAICELLATNVIGDQTFEIPGAVVCEAHDGHITRMAAYPDAVPMQAFLSALEAAVVARGNG